MLEQAVTATKSLDHKVLADYLRKNEMKTIVGPIRFDPNGEWANPRVVQVQFRGVVDKNVEQFRAAREAGRSCYPDQYKTGEIVAPFEKARAASRRDRATRPTAARCQPRAVFLESRTLFSFELLLEAILFGILLGCFYAAVSIGLSVSFGLLDVPHVAHPAVMVFGGLLHVRARPLRPGSDPRRSSC